MQFVTHPNLEITFAARLAPEVTTSGQIRQILNQAASLLLFYFGQWCWRSEFTVLGPTDFARWRRLPLWLGSGPLTHFDGRGVAADMARQLGTAKGLDQRFMNVLGQLVDRKPRKSAAEGRRRRNVAGTFPAAEPAQSRPSSQRI